MELYFEEYFEEIIENWDLMRKDEVRNWSEDMNSRLDSVAKDINSLKARRKQINTEFDSMETRIKTMEDEWRKERET